MSRDAQKIIEAVNAYNAEGGVPPLHYIYSTLLGKGGVRGRLLAGKQFDALPAALEKILALYPVHVNEEVMISWHKNPKQNMQDRCASLSFIGFWVASSGDSVSQMLEPVTVHVRISAGEVTYLTRPIPLYISADHIAERMEEKRRQPLNYNQPEFSAAVQLSIVMSRILTKENSAGLNRVVIPYFNPANITSSIPGLIVGWGVSVYSASHSIVEPFGFDPSSLIIRQKAGRAVAYNTFDHPEGSPPRIGLFMRTFLKMSDLKDGQSSIFHAFRRMFESPGMIEALKNEVRLYSGNTEASADSFKPKEKSQRAALYGRVEEIMTSSTYLAEAHRPMSQLEERSEFVRRLCR